MEFYEQSSYFRNEVQILNETEFNSLFSHNVHDYPRWIILDIVAKHGY